MYAPTEASAPGVRLIDAGTIPIFDRWVGSWRLSLHRRALTAQELALSYDRAASDRDRTLSRLDYPSAYEALLRNLLSERPLGNNSSTIRALDCGVGTGELSRALARVIRHTDDRDNRPRA